MYLKVHPVPLSYVYEEHIKFWWGSMFFFDSLQLQDVASMFLFSMKHSYLLTAKIGPNVDNFL